MIRVILGEVESMDIFIYDVSGQKVHSATLNGASPAGIYDGRYFYEYTCQGPKASGVYFAVIHAKVQGQVLRAKAKFAVVR